MPVNMTKLNVLAAEWDPGPFLEAIEQASAMPVADPQPGGAMDMGVGMQGWADVMGQAPKAPPAALPGGFMQSAMKATQGAGTNPHVAPAAPVQAPRGVPMTAFPGMPRAAQIPNLEQLLGGR